MRRIAVVECNRDFLARFLFRLQNGFTFLFIRSHGLFGDDVGTQLHSPDNKFMVCSIYRGNDKRFRLNLLHHLFEVRKRWAAQPGLLLEVF